LRYSPKVSRNTYKLEATQNQNHGKVDILKKKRQWNQLMFVLIVELEKYELDLSDEIKETVFV
jgi:hypothetical protein